MKTKLLIWAFCSLFASSLFAGTSDLLLSIQPAKGKEGGYMLLIENTGDSAASYFGYGGEGSTQPVFKTEIKKGNDWVDQSLAWCGNGMGACNIRGKEKISTSFYGIPQDQGGIQFRISILVTGVDAAQWDHQPAIRLYSPLYEWKTGKIEQVGADQPATAPKLKLEGKDQPQPESEARSR